MSAGCVLVVSGCVYMCVIMLVMIYHFGMLVCWYDVIDKGKPLLGLQLTTIFLINYSVDYFLDQFIVLSRKYQKIVNI